MKKTNLSRKATMALGAVMAAVAVPSFMAYGTDASAVPADDPLEPYCLMVTPDPAGSMSGAGYVGEAIYVDADNNEHSRGTFGVDLTIEEVTTDRYDDNGYYVGTVTEPQITNLKLVSVKAGENDTKVYLPDAISVAYNGKTLTHDITDISFSYYTPEQGKTDKNSFVDSPNLKDVYVGPSACHVTWAGEDFLKLRNFHFRSEDVAMYSFEEGANGTINIYVPEELFEHYADVIGGASYTATVWSENPLSPTYVNVDIPGTLADAISSNIDNLNHVRWLVVTGTPNEQDLRMMRRLPRLEILDLSTTTGLTTMVGCNGLKYLHEVKLPEEITYIDEDAFRNCSALSEMELPVSVKEIKQYAFANSGMRKINLENVERFGYQAFAYSKLEAIKLECAKDIGGYAFAYNHSLEDVTLSKVETIEYSAFESCNLNTISIPNSCHHLSYYAFNYNSNLKDVELGSGLKSIAEDWGGSFGGCPIEKVTVRTLFPTKNSGFKDVNLENATLYVPALTLNEYLLADGWTMFENVKPLDEELTEVNIDRTFMLTSDKGIAKGANLTLTEGEGYYDNNGNWKNGLGQLTVRRNINAPLNLGKYCQSGRKDLYENWTSNGYEYKSYYYGNTLIPYSEMTAEDVELKLKLRTDRWHFISLPFDVNVADIKTTDEALWVVRKYSGEDRAALSGNTWQNMTEVNTLKAGEGYIFHCAHDKMSEVDFTFKPAYKEDDKTEGYKLFAKDAVVYDLAEYKSDLAHNASWNLTGNTYPAFLNLHAIGFEAPVTIYNGNTYIAYSPEDDDLVLSPFQAFFVQRQDTDGGDKLTLNPEGRAHTEEEAAALSIDRRKAPAFGTQSNRSLFNIHIKGEAGHDRTRLVVNENASIAYEKNRDASKFMSSEKSVPQIFVMNDNSRMAIDERPLGNGRIALGAYFGSKGEYTVSLDTRNADGYTAILIDHKTGVETDLTTGDYTFETEAVTDQNRFTLVLKGEATAAESIAAEDVEVRVNGNELTVTAPEDIDVTVAAADGKTVAAGRGAHFSAVLEKGIYAVKAGTKTVKVIVGK